MNPSTDETGPPNTGASVAAFEIAIACEQDFVAVEPQRLAEFARSVLREEGLDGGRISIALVDDAAIHELNRRFLGHDCPTDVISFSLDEPAEPDRLSQDAAADASTLVLAEAEAGFRESLVGQTPFPGSRSRDVKLVDGEVVISAETARRVAGEIGCEPAQELALYLVHGLLHLCGYDDQSASDRRQMRQRETSHLQNLNLPANYEA